MEELSKPSKSSHHGIRLQCTNRRAGDCPKGTVLPPKIVTVCSGQYSSVQVKGSFVPIHKSAQICTAGWFEAWRCSWLWSCTITAVQVLARAGGIRAFWDPCWTVCVSVSKAMSYRNYLELLNPTYPFSIIYLCECLSWKSRVFPCRAALCRSWLSILMPSKLCFFSK